MSEIWAITPSRPQPVDRAITPADVVLLGFTPQRPFRANAPCHRPIAGQYIIGQYIVWQYTVGQYIVSQYSANTPRHCIAPAHFGNTYRQPAPHHSATPSGGMIPFHTISHNAFPPDFPHGRS